MVRIKMNESRPPKAGFLIAVFPWAGSAGKEAGLPVVEIAQPIG